MSEIPFIILLAAATAIPMAIYGRDIYANLDKNINDKLEELPEFCKNSRTVRIATDFDPRFFGKKDVLGAFRAAAKKGCKMKFMTDIKREKLRSAFKECRKEAKENVSFVEYEKLSRKDNVDIKYVKKLNKHLWVIDDSIVRIEAPHEPLQFGKGVQKEGYGMLFKNLRDFGRMCSGEFDEAWKRSA